MRVELLYGRSGLSLELPVDADVTVLKKQAMPLASAGAVEAALEAAPGSFDWRPQGDGDRVCILICDVTRPVPNGLILPPLLKKFLAGGFKREQIGILVATGLHRPNLGGELAALLGDPWVAENFTVENHYAQNGADHLDLGTSSLGVPIKLDARFVRARVKIVAGLVEPHFMAGWSGGRKVVIPGICAAETIRSLHSFPFMDDPRSRDCNLDGNPVHRAQLEALELLGPVYALNTVLDEERRLAFVNFGEALESHGAAVDFVRPHARRDLPESFDTVVTSAAGYPLDQTYYQTVKGLVGAARLLAPGGRLFIASQCGEGLGSPDFAASQKRLVELGPEAFEAYLKNKKLADVDEWQSQMLLRALKAGSVVLFSDGLSSEEKKLTAALCVSDLGTAVREWLAGRADKRVAVIPEGPYLAPFTHCRGGDAGGVQCKGRQFRPGNFPRALHGSDPDETAG